MRPGRLRVYLGVAPGVGCTHAMLDEAVRRRRRGTDVVVAAVERRHLNRLEGLELIGDGSQVLTAAVQDRAPAVALVDDLGETAPEGEPRWRAVERLLAAGVDVIATTDITAVASLHDVVADLVGQTPARTVPDRVLLQADQVELVDMTPEALRRRLAHGGLYSAEEVTALRAVQFAPATLAALRELALGWMTGLVRRQRADAEPQSAIAHAETRERLLVALSGSKHDRALLDRASRLSQRLGGAELSVVHVIAASSRSTVLEPGIEPSELAADAGASYLEVIGDDVAIALLDLARAQHATLVVGGPTARQRWRGRLVEALVAADEVDVLVVPRTDGTPGPRLARPARALPRGRLWTGYATALVLPVALLAGLQPLGGWLGLAGVSLSFMAVVVTTALVGGLGPAVLSAVVCSTLLNYFFIPPLHTLAIGEPHNMLTVALFVGIGVLVGAVVHRGASQAALAVRASAESRMLAKIAEGTLQGKKSLTILLEQVRASFGMRSVSVLGREDRNWSTVESVGSEPAGEPGLADVVIDAGPDLVLALSGRTLSASDRAILAAVGAQVRGVMERDRLERSARSAARLEATERLRDALLVALGHDLRTPLATARAALVGLRTGQAGITDTERAELLSSAERALERLSRLVADLLDLSRLRAGALSVRQEPVWLDDVISPALDELGGAAVAVELRVGDDLPPVLADAALLKRVVVNVVGNALTHAPASPILISGSATSSYLELRVIDHGPGVAPEDRTRIFTPFQRLGDTDQRGLGLGLALSRGLLDAMGGTLAAEETPGGGLTMVITLPLAVGLAEVAPEPGQREREEER